MKRIIIAFFAVLFCAAAFVFLFIGEQIREALAPCVTICDVLYAGNGYVLPKDAVQTDENGEAYVLLVRKSEKFPERGYEAKRINCEIVGIVNDDAVLMFESNIPLGEKAITASDRPVSDGNKVIIK